MAQTASPPKAGRKAGTFTKGDARINRTKPGTGRPPEAFRQMCRELACSAEEAAAIALQNPKHPAFIGALRWATEHGYGKPKETHEHRGKFSVTVRLAHEGRRVTAS